MMGWTIIVLSQLLTVALWMAAKVLVPALTPAQAGTQIVALLGIMCLIWTFVLAIRHSAIENLFGGLDKVYKAHHILGGLAFILLLNHALLLIVGSMPADTLALYLIPGTSLSYSLGILSLYFMLFLLALTFYIPLPYRYWKWTHEWMGIVILLGGLHSMLISSDTARYMPLRYWILSWCLIAVCAFLYKRFIYYLAKLTTYRIVTIVKEQELLLISLECLGEPIRFAPGQFGFFSLPNKKRDDHAFSILSSTGNKLIVGIKVLGSFTNKLTELKTGDELMIKGPYGKFADKMTESKHMVWVAGGIGITPFLSMAKAVTNEQKVEMYFCAKVLPPPVMTEPFASLSARNPQFVWLPCETSKGGRLVASNIFAQTGSDKNAYYMMCGPKGMMEGLAEQFALLGIKRSHIIYEDFSFK